MGVSTFALSGCSIEIIPDNYINRQADVRKDNIDFIMMPWIAERISLVLRCTKIEKGNEIQFLPAGNLAGCPPIVRLGQPACVPGWPSYFEISSGYNYTNFSEFKYDNFYFVCCV